MGDRLVLRGNSKVLAVILFVAVMSSASAAVGAPVARGTVRASRAVVAPGPAGFLDIATSGVGESLATATYLGLPGRSTSFSGSLTLGTDEDDVHKVLLEAGEVVTFEVDAGESTDYGMFIYAPEALVSDIPEPYDYVPPYYYGGPESYPIDYTFTVPVSGYYYIWVFTWNDGTTADGGSGPYELTVDVEGSGTTIQFDPLGVLDYGVRPTISGRLVSRFAGETPTGTVVLSMQLPGENGAMVTAASQETASDGTFLFRNVGYLGIYPMQYNALYVVNYQGNYDFASSAANLFVDMRNKLSTPTASRYGTRSYTLAGYSESQHPRGAVIARIYVWRYVNGGWKPSGYRSATASDSGGRSRYSVKYKFPATGRWRIRAYHSDLDHAPTWSDYSYFTVR